MPENLIALGNDRFRPPFPTAVDSTMMKTFRGCRQKFFLEYMLHWKSKAPSIHLHAGQAFATALEEVRRAYWEQGMPPEDALAVGTAALITAYGTFDQPHDTAKTLPRMLGALDYYFERYPLEHDQLKPYKWGPNKYAIEFTFASPLPFYHPETGDPIIYTGRSDFIGEMNDALWIVDDKTTSQLGAQWMNQWDLRSQFTGYTWAGRDVGSLPIVGCIVRGVSILKTKYDTQQVITYRPQMHVERWLNQTLRDLHAMRQCWEEGYWDFNLDEECNSYGGCMFRRICISENPQDWLEADFEKRVWDPLERTEIKLIEGPK